VNFLTTTETLQSIVDMNIAIVVDRNRYTPIMASSFVLDLLNLFNIEDISKKNISDFFISPSKLKLCNNYEQFINSYYNGYFEQKPFVFINDDKKFYKLHIYKLKIYYVICFVDITGIINKNSSVVDSIKVEYLHHFTSNIIHEINTPITYIMGNIEMLKMSLSHNSDMNIFMDSIQNGMNRIIKKINSIKEFSYMYKTNSDKINLYTSMINALKIVYENLKSITPIYINDILFYPSIDENRENYNIKACKYALEEVWIIIINNSVDELIKVHNNYEDRYIKVYIIENIDTIKVQIKDNGGGIREDVLDDMFKKFVTSKSSHYGMGLDIANSIIKNYNTNIVAYNEDNVAVFEITFEKGKE